MDFTDWKTVSTISLSRGCRFRGNPRCWARLLAYVTGMVNQELLLRNEYLGAEVRSRVGCCFRKVKRRH